MLATIFRNGSLKLLALALAFAVWVAITGESRVLEDAKVPLDFDLDEQMVVAGTPPTSVTVRLRGTEAELRRAEARGLVLRVDLKDAVPGERNVQLSPRGLIGLPAGVEVARIEPDRLGLRLERRATRRIPVVPSVTGKPPRGYRLYGVAASPPDLEVEGPESEVAKLERLRTDSIRIDGRTASFNVTVGAVPESRDVRVVEPAKVSARVEIDAAPVEAAFDGVPVALAGRDREAAAVPSSVRVVLSGPPDVLARIRPAALRAVANLAGPSASTPPGTVGLRLEMPGVPEQARPRISLRSMTPSSVAVRFPSRRESP